MRVLVLSAALVAVFAAVISSVGKSQDRKTTAPRRLTSNQLLMRDKLVQMNRILEGITLDKFNQVQDGAQTLGMISRAAAWHIADPTPQYQRMTRNFQEQAADLERHAKDRNVEAATLDLVRMNVTCTQCHLHMREEAARRR
jgi:hypothetical protein